MCQAVERVLKEANSVERIEDRDLWKVKYSQSGTDLYGLIDGRGVWLYPPKFVVLSVFIYSLKGTFVLSQHENQNEYWLQKLGEGQPIFDEPISWVSSLGENALPDPARLDFCWDILFTSKKRILWNPFHQKIDYDLSGFAGLVGKFEDANRQRGAVLNTRGFYFSVSKTGELCMLRFSHDGTNGTVSVEPTGVCGVDYMIHDEKVLERFASGMVLLNMAGEQCDINGCHQRNPALYFIRSRKSILLNRNADHQFVPYQNIFQARSPVVFVRTHKEWDRGLNNFFSWFAYDTETGEPITELPIDNWWVAQLTEDRHYFINVAGNTLQIDKEPGSIDKWNIRHYDDVVNAHKWVAPEPVAKNWGIP